MSEGTVPSAFSTQSDGVLRTRLSHEGVRCLVEINYGKMWKRDVVPYKWSQKLMRRQHNTDRKAGIRTEI